MSQMFPPHTSFLFNNIFTTSNLPLLDFIRQHRTISTCIYLI